MWMRKAGRLLSLFVLCASLSAQALPSPSSSPSTGPSSGISSEQAASWQTLEMLLSLLDSESLTLISSSENLENLLKQALKDSQLLSTKLQLSETRLSELENSLALSAAQLQSSSLSLASVRTQVSQLSRERNLWRIVGVVGLAGTVAAVVWGITR